MAPCAYVSSVGWHKRRDRRKCCHGNIGLCLWSSKGRKYLVSHQLAGRVGLHAIGEACTRATEFVSCRQLCDCSGPAHSSVHPGWIVVWRNASYVSEETNCPRRFDCTSFVVRIAIHNFGAAESIAGQAH